MNFKKSFFKKTKKNFKINWKNVKLKTKKKYEKLNSFQFLKYHVFNDHSFGNNLPLIYWNYMYKETGISMNKNFLKKKGL